jgi:hypothetical protein
LPPGRILEVDACGLHDKRGGGPAHAFEASGTINTGEGRSDLAAADGVWL